MENIVIIGNCQTNIITQIAQLILDDFNVTHIHSAHIKDPNKHSFHAEKVEKANYIISQPLSDEVFGPFGQSRILEFGKRTTFVPSILFQGYHPDCIYLNSGKLKSPIGDYHSALVSICFKLGKSVEETYAAFNSLVFEGAEYFDFFDREKQNIKNAFNKFSLDIADKVDELFGSAKLMHTTNHPTLYLLDEFTKSAFRNAEIPFKNLPTEQFIVDNFPNSTVFPVYPEIAKKLGLLGTYYFKPANNTSSSNIYNLCEFIEASYEIYQKVNGDELSNPRLTPEYIKKLDSVITSSAAYNRPRNQHPYKDKPDYCFWKKSISSVDIKEVDPVISFPFRISKEQKIATAGSCFAQHIARELAKSGYNYFVSETKPADLTLKEAAAQGYNIFSARYGNIYTARQLLQLFDRAFDQFSPSIDAWIREDGALVDPFRPQVIQNGFSDIESLIKSRKEHLKCVKNMFESLDIFVFTLGLTEAWIHKADGSILPIAPGVAGGTMDTQLYDFVNFQYNDIKEDLITFIEKLKYVNPKAKVILTVSPVPLIATYENRHVLVSTTVSKAILRAAADEISRQQSNVSYFPSYEVITGNFNHGSYYEKDLREIREEGVAHVMKLFMKHCTVSGPESSAEHSELENIICDEESLHVD